MTNLILKIVVIITFAILSIMCIVKIHNECNIIKNLKKNIGKIESNHWSKLVIEISNFILYSVTIICMITNNIIPLCIAVVIDIVINYIVISKCIKTFKIFPPKV